MAPALEPLPSSLVEALSAIVSEPTFGIRVVAGGIIGILIYAAFGALLHYIFYRKVRRRGVGEGRGARAPPAIAHVGVALARAPRK